MSGTNPRRVAATIRSAGGPVSSLSAALFALLSGVRRKRVFHPKGDAYAGRVVMSPTTFDLPFEGEHEVTIRFSRGAGLPEPVPDLYGIAIKFTDPRQDLLFATSGRGTVTRHALLPTTGLFRLPYSSVLPYRLHGELVTLGAEADPALVSSKAQRLRDLGHHIALNRLRFDLTIAAVGDKRTHRFGTLIVDSERVGDVSFNPWNTHADLQPAGGLNRLRRKSYESSQAARPEQTSMRKEI